MSALVRDFNQEAYDVSSGKTGQILETKERLKKRALLKAKQYQFTQGTTLARPTVGQKKDSMSLFDVNTDMPSLLGDF